MSKLCFYVCRSCPSPCRRWSPVTHICSLRSVLGPFLSSSVTSSSHMVWCTICNWTTQMCIISAQFAILSPGSIQPRLTTLILMAHISNSGVGPKDKFYFTDSPIKTKQNKQPVLLLVICPQVNGIMCVNSLPYANPTGSHQTFLSLRAFFQSSAFATELS